MFRESEQKWEEKKTGAEVKREVFLSIAATETQEGSYATKPVRVEYTYT